jgi:hypothetical protein
LDLITEASIYLGMQGFPSSEPVIVTATGDLQGLAKQLHGVFSAHDLAALLFLPAPVLARPTLRQTAAFRIKNESSKSRTVTGQWIF